MDNRTNEEILQELNKNKINEYGVVIGYTAVVIVSGILGNIASVIFYGFKSRRTTTNTLIMYLAATDLIACVVFCDVIFKLCFTFNFTDRIGCKFLYFFNHWLVVLSGCMLLVICVDRFRKICRPLKWQFTYIKTKLFVGGVVVFAFLTSVRDFVITEVVHINITDPDTGRQIEAHYCTRTKELALQTVVTISHLLDVFIFLVIIISLIVIYTIIAVRLWKYHRKNNLTEFQRNHVEGNDESSQTTIVSASVSTEKKSDPAEDVFEMKTTNKLEATKNNEHKTTTDTDEGANAHASDKYNNHIETVNDTLPTSTAIGKSKVPDESDREYYKKNDHKDMKKSSHRHANIERNVTIMMITITTVSILSFVPYFIVNLTLKRTSETPEYEFDVGIQIALRSFILNNAVNPYITVLFNPVFRRFVKKCFQNILCCTTANCRR